MGCGAREAGMGEIGRDVEAEGLVGGAVLGQLDPGVELEGAEALGAGMGGDIGTGW